MKRIKNLLNKRSAIVAGFAIIGLATLIISSAATSFFSIEPENDLISGCYQLSDDNLASGGQAVKFGSSDGCKLDHSGKTIPSNNYPIPSGAVFMSPSGSDKASSSVDGNDSNNGSTVNTPVRTISRAISIVPDNGTIVMRGGEYRDWHTNTVGDTVHFEGKSFTLQAYPSESPWFNGADVVNSGWVSSGNNTWSRTWDTPNFCGAGQYYKAVEGGKPPFAPNLTATTPCAYWDAVKDNPNVAGDPQNVFINDTKLSQVPNISQVTTDSFYYDWGNKKMYIGQNPSGKKVELTKRPQALMLNKGTYGIKGIGFKRYGSGGYGGGAYWFTANAVLINEPQSAIIENSVFVDNSQGGLTFSKPKNGSKVISSVFAHNGGTALGSNGSRSSGERNDFIIDSSVFNSNNEENFDTNCSASCGAANVKLNNMVGFTAKNSVFENTVGRAPGLWCDVHCSDGVIVNNLVQNNGDRGIFYEISRDGIIANNLVLDNGTRGISVTSANVKIYNNTVTVDRTKNPGSIAIDIFDDDRCASCQNDSGIGPDTANIELVNNIAVAKGDAQLSVSLHGPQVGTNTKASQFYIKFDYNAYHRSSSGNLFYTWKNDNGSVDYIKSSAAFTNKTGFDSNALDLSGSSDPFFVDKANGDYRVRSNSQAHLSGQPLSQEIAQLIGVQAGQPINRGAISWPKF